MRASLKPGLATQLKYVVPEERTAPCLLPESGHFRVLPAVLATGYLVGIVEWACMSVLNGHLDRGEQTLGIHVDLSHEAPTPPGSLLVVEATLDAIDGNRLTFSVHAFDEAATVCRGIHRRAVIQADRFVRRMKSRTR
jgi:fluoroacetyl-CoA thioesterase